MGTPATAELLSLNQSYTQLPSIFFEEVAPTAVSNPAPVIFNNTLAEALGLDFSSLSNSQKAALFSGNTLPDNLTPIAQAYAGHQFGHFTILGDGRAILLGEQLTPSGESIDIQLKGAGPTAYSRNGDGRATLGPMLREYIISEGLHALGIPTTRSLAVVTTGNTVYREKALPGAILARTASSHIRVGTFEYAATLGDIAALKALADYAINRHYPDIATHENPYLDFLKAVIQRQAALIAKWQSVGFIHGVMNTDNMTISGETIDYGPCAFMDEYHPATVFSSIDRRGRYAYANQPVIAQWNLARLAESLLPLISDDPNTAATLATEAVTHYSEKFDAHWQQAMGIKLGLSNVEPGDKALINELLAIMSKHKADFTNTFRQLSLEENPNSPLAKTPDFIDWHTQWQKRLQSQGTPWESAKQIISAHNPVIIPRNHLVDKALTAAVNVSNLTPFNELLTALTNPYTESLNMDQYTKLPTDDERVTHTFCGT